MRIVLAGATGFIGKTLVARLLKTGHEVIVLTRNAGPVARPQSGMTFIPWNGKDPGEWCARLNGTDAVINLAGENIAAKPWTESQKKRILASRMDATGAIVRAVLNAENKPGLLVNASAVGYYGNVPEGDVTESFPRGAGFLADVCERWEGAAFRAEDAGVRVVAARFGIVLEKDGGALQRMLLPFKLFAGGPLGSGRQWVPWIHREDLVGALMFFLAQTSLAGPVNVTAPDPRRMEEFCRVLGRTVRRPSWVRTPPFILRSVLGEMSSMILDGARAVPEKLLAAGFRFQYPDLEAALLDIFRR